MKIFGMAWKFAGLYFLSPIAIGMLNTVTGFKSSTGATTAAIVVIVWVVVEKFAKEHQRYLTKSEFWAAFGTFWTITMVIDLMFATIAMQAVKAPLKVWVIGLVLGAVLHVFSIWIGFWAGKKRLIKQGFNVAFAESSVEGTLKPGPSV